MARAYIELPPGWGPGRIIITACRAGGYECEEHRFPGRDERIVTLCPQLTASRSTTETSGSAILDVKTSRRPDAQAV